MDENMKYDLEYFIHVSHASIWWFINSEISTCSVIYNPHVVATMSMNGDHAPMIVPLIYARSIILDCNKLPHLI
jgi:ribosomal protein L30E